MMLDSFGQIQPWYLHSSATKLSPKPTSVGLANGTEYTPKSWGMWGLQHSGRGSEEPLEWIGFCYRLFALEWSIVVFSYHLFVFEINPAPQDPPPPCTPFFEYWHLLSISKCPPPPSPLYRPICSFSLKIDIVLRYWWEYTMDFPTVRKRLVKYRCLFKDLSRNSVFFFGT